MWAKLDHGFFRNPKTLTVGADARLLYLAAVCYAGDRLTDGVVPDDALPLIAAEAQVADAADAVARLLAAGLWHAVTGGWRIHDFFDWNASAKKIKARRDASRARAAASRARAAARRAAALAGELDGSDDGTPTSPSRPRERTTTVRAHASHTSARTNAHDSANVARTNRAKDSDVDSDSESSLSPPPPALTDAVVSVHSSAREPDGDTWAGAPGTEPTPLAPAPPRAVPKPKERARAALESHPLYDPLVTLFGRPPDRDLDAWQDDLAAFDELGATPDDVPRRAAAYAQMMGTDTTGRPIMLTRAALVRHWHRCATAPPPPPRALNDGRMPIHGELNAADYTGNGKWARFFNRPYDDDGDDHVDVTAGVAP